MIQQLSQHHLRLGSQSGPIIGISSFFEALTISGVRMDGGSNSRERNFIDHGDSNLGNHLTGTVSHYNTPKNGVSPLGGKNFDESLLTSITDCSIIVL